MLQPKRVKYRYQFRGNTKGKRTRGSQMAFGEFGVKAMEPGWVKANQIEAARKAITHYTKRKAKVWIRAFPDKPVSQKAPGAPMGAGKGDISHWAAVVRPGKIIFEIEGVDEETAREALKRAIHKLPVKSRIVQRKAK